MTFRRPFLYLRSPLNARRLERTIRGKFGQPGAAASEIFSKIPFKISLIF